MFSSKPTSSRSFQNRDSGFTLIEVVSVLSLIGILAAVAVPKYLDVQEEAARKACLANQAIVERAALERWLAARLIGQDVRALTGKASLQELVASLDRSGGLCPDGGTIDVVPVMELDPSEWGNDQAASEVSFKASCSHGHDARTDPDEPMKVVADDAFNFMEWLLSSDIYGVGQGKYALDGSKNISTIDQFFSKYNTSGFIDSEADFKGANFQDGDYRYKDAGGNEVASVTAMVKAAMEQSGMDTDGLIWRLERTKCDPVDYLRDPSGNLVRDANGHRIPTQYSTELVLTVAQRPDGNLNGQPVGKAYQYAARVTYSPKKYEEDASGKWKDVSKGSDNRIENILIGNAPKEVTDLKYTLAKDKSGKEYLVLDTRRKG